MSCSANFDISEGNDDDPPFCDSADGCEYIHLGCAGSPCPPFSKQRSKRNVEGSVRAHRDYNTTFTSLVKWLVKFHPGVFVMEQVTGFDEPEDVHDPSTPMRRYSIFFSQLCDLVCVCEVFAVIICDSPFC